jgi:Pyridoxamine 5'-phosphate oxidase
MARWEEVAAAAPDLSRTAREYLDAGKLKTIATLRADGAPRIGGTEIFFHDGELWFGCMWRARKALDLRRDARCALHSASVDPPEWTGDATLSGRAIEIEDPARAAAVFEAIGHPQQGPAHLFRLDVTEVTTVRIGDPPDHLVVESWVEGRGVRRREKR